LSFFGLFRSFASSSESSPSISKHSSQLFNSA
jgi:hypothetical protein